MSVRFGYKASAEQFGPRELTDYSRRAEEVGLKIVAVSDHFQPWRHRGGHAPNALVWLGAVGEATERAVIGSSVLTPTMRYEPAVIAQAFGTLGALYPGRVFLGVGTGEAMNETPATAAGWPGFRERSGRLALSMCSPAFGLAGLAGSGLALDRLGLDRLGLDRLRALPLALVARPDDVPRARLDFRSGGAVRVGQPHSAIRASSVRRVIWSEAATSCSGVWGSS